MYFSFMGLLIWHITDNILGFLAEIKSQLITQDEFSLEVHRVQPLTAAEDEHIKSAPPRPTHWKHMHAVLQQEDSFPSLPTPFLLFCHLELTEGSSL